MDCLVIFGAKGSPRDFLAGMAVICWTMSWHVMIIVGLLATSPWMPHQLMWSAWESGLVPTGVTQVPAGVTQVPTGVTQVPTGVTQVPTGVTQVPTGVTQVPTGVTQVPAGVTSVEPAIRKGSYTATHTKSCN